MVITNWKLYFTRFFLSCIAAIAILLLFVRDFFVQWQDNPKKFACSCFFKGSTLLQEICLAEVLTFRYISIANWFVQERREAKCVDAMEVKLTFSARQTLHSNLLLLYKTMKCPYSILWYVSGTKWALIGWISGLYSKVPIAWLRVVFSSSIQFPRDLIKNLLTSFSRSILKLRHLFFSNLWPWCFAIGS